MFVAILFVFTIFAGQLLRIQAFDASATQAAALSKRTVKTTTPAMRGQILDTNGQVLADSVERFTIAADPTVVPAYTVPVDGVREQVGVTRAAADLAPLLDMTPAQLTKLLTRANTRYVVIKKGEHGAFMFTSDSVFFAPAYPLETVFDPTGAGDSFAGGFIGSLAASGDLSPASMRRAVVVGSAMGSFAVEQFSNARLMELTRAEIDARVREFQQLVAFDADLAS